MGMEDARCTRASRRGAAIATRCGNSLSAYTIKRGLPGGVRRPGTIGHRYYGRPCGITQAGRSLDHVRWRACEIQMQDLPLLLDADRFARRARAFGRAGRLDHFEIGDGDAGEV